MRFYEITEARRNATHPSQQRLSPAQTLLKYKNAGDDYFITFTDLPKVGINPQSPYGTPIGIYCYPIKPFAARMKDDHSIGQFSSKFPFASDRKYFFILRATKPMVIAQEYSEYRYKKDIEKLKNITQRHDLDFEPSDTQKHTPFGFIWENLHQASLFYPKSEVMWNKLMRQLEWNGVVDNGGGYIHDNEQTQAFFLQPQAYEVVEKYEIHSRDHSMVYSILTKTLSKSDKKKLENLHTALKNEDIEKIKSSMVTLWTLPVRIAYGMISNYIITKNKPKLLTAFTVSQFQKFLNEHRDFVEKNLKELVDFSYSNNNKGSRNIYNIYNIDTDIADRWIEKYDFYFDGMVQQGGNGKFAKKYYDRILDGTKDANNKAPWKNISVLVQADMDFPLELASEKYKTLWPFLVKYYGDTDIQIPFAIIEDVLKSDQQATDYVSNKQIQLMTDDEKIKFVNAYTDNIFDNYQAGKFSYHGFPWYYLSEKIAKYAIGYIKKKMKNAVESGKLDRTDVKMLNGDLKYVKDNLARFRGI